MLAMQLAMQLATTQLCNNHSYRRILFIALFYFILFYFVFLQKYHQFTTRCSSWLAGPGEHTDKDGHIDCTRYSDVACSVSEGTSIELCE